jgi:hypothetical protein
VDSNTVEESDLSLVDTVITTIAGLKVESKVVQEFKKELEISASLISKIKVSAIPVLIPIGIDLAINNYLAGRHSINIEDDDEEEKDEGLSSMED